MVTNHPHIPRQAECLCYPMIILRLIGFYKIKMTAFFKRRTGANQVFRLKMLVGTAAQMTAFRKLHEVLNDYCYSVLVEMCGDNQTAMLQVSALYVSDPDCWVNTLWLALEQRFTQERIIQVQKYLINLGKFSFVQGGTVQGDD